MPPEDRRLKRIDDEIKDLEENVKDCYEYPRRFLNVGHMLARLPESDYDTYIERLQKAEKLADEFNRKCSCREMTEEEIIASRPFEQMLKPRKKKTS